MYANLQSLSQTLPGLLPSAFPFKSSRPLPRKPVNRAVIYVRCCEIVADFLLPFGGCVVICSGCLYNIYALYTVAVSVPYVTHGVLAATPQYTPRALSWGNNQDCIAIPGILSHLIKFVKFPCMKT